MNDVWPDRNAYRAFDPILVEPDPKPAANSAIWM
jgi:hypothetical protein